jgi:hypothetical protein
MKSRRTQIISLIATILIIGGFVLVPGKATAQTPNGPVANPTGGAGALNNLVNHPWQNFFYGPAYNAAAGMFGTTPGAVTAKAVGICTGVTDCINGALMVLGNFGLRISNLILTISGIALNAVMIITLNMSTLMGGSNNIIDATWSTIRDLASIIIIFFLLYESIKIIIGVSDSKVKHIIVMVAIAGILLNFSLFFAKMGVDASNLVGLAFYRAIAPSGANLDLSSATISAGNFIDKTITSGGISDEFMKALKIQTADAYQTGNIDPLTIIQSALYGTILQLIAAFVFLAAAFLFLIRIGLLVVLLVFSPFYFIGLIVPKVEEKISKPWLDMIIDQCLILPIFMFFMYITLRVITNPGFQSIINPAGGSTTLGGSAAATIGMFIQYFIAIILICISLVAALKYASVGKDLVNKGIKNAKGWAARGVQKGAQQTAGRAANFIQNKAAQSDWAKNNPNAALMFNKAAGVVSTASFGDKKSKDGFVGGEKKRKEGQDKARKDLYERTGNVNREDYAFGEKGQEEYEKEKKAAFERQAKLVENMKTETVMSRMMGDNPNARSQYKLEKDYNADYGKEYSNKIDEEMKANREELTKIAELLNPENTLKLIGQDRSVESLRADQTRLEKKNNDLSKYKDAAARKREADALKEIAKSVNEMSKKDKTEESSDSKKEKSSKDDGGGEDKK